MQLGLKQIAAGLRLDDRVECMAKESTYIIPKDYKDNFGSGHPCRLIKPCKSKTGKISKSVLGNIYSNLVKLPEVNQWRNSDSIMKWFSPSVRLSCWIM